MSPPAECQVSLLIESLKAEIFELAANIALTTLLDRHYNKKF